MKMRWQEILEKIADRNRGNVGIEIELAIRSDLMTDSGADFDEFVHKYGFSSGYDGSIKIKPYTVEHYYQTVEIMSQTGSNLTKVLSGLAPIVAWLKKRDLVRVRNRTEYGGYKIEPKRGPGVSRRELDPKEWTDIELPRGMIPRTITAGVHLHLDVRQWFDNSGHLQRFISFINDSSTELKAQVIKQRYQNVGTATDKPQGDEYAEFRSSKEYPKPDPGQSIHNWLDKVNPFDRYRAVNIERARDRGDVEVRIFHATLNIKTITHWFNLLLEMVDTTRDPETTPQDWDKFMAMVDPETSDQVIKRSKHYDKSQWDQTSRVYPSKRVSRILGLPKPPPQDPANPAYYTR